MRSELSLDLVEELLIRGHGRSHSEGVSKAAESLFGPNG